jgi:hypothetical protein
MFGDAVIVRREVRVHKSAKSIRLMERGIY